MMDLHERMDRFDKSDLYVVITEAFCGEHTPIDVLDACLEAGVRLVQFREKDFGARELYARACLFRERTRRAGALLIVNDRVDLALAVEADGVHLGQDDLPFEVARRIAPELLLGASSHDPEQAAAAQAAGASYVNIGPIYATQTKTTAVPPVGPEMIRRVLPRLSVPMTCMGGIKAHNIHEVVQAGARHVAVVTAVTAAADVGAAARELRELIRRAMPQSTV
jgi:thiamine-phosphate pyrophosphorylase